MRNTLLTILMILTMVVTSVGPALAQDNTQVHLPLLSSGAANMATNQAYDGDGPVYLPFLSTFNGLSSVNEIEAARVKYEDKYKKWKEKKDKRITHNDRKTAAARALQQGMLNPLMIVALQAGRRWQRQPT